MHGLKPSDPGRELDWGKTSEDYAKHRPGPPDSFFERLRALGVGLVGQRILDLGTGTGVLARQFARQGAKVSGTDVSEGQIEAAKALAEKQGLDVDFRASPAEVIPYETRTFDAITANQCWLYFDLSRTVPEVKRALRANGQLVTSHFSWLPRLDPIAQAAERLIFKHNPSWSAGDWSGDVPPFPDWAKGQFRLRAMFTYDEPIAFTREAWRGRIRACRGVGAALAKDEVKRFDLEHAEWLEANTAGSFTVLHRIDAHLLEPLA